MGASNSDDVSVGTVSHSCSVGAAYSTFLSSVPSPSMYVQSQ